MSKNPQMDKVMLRVDRLTPSFPAGDENVKDGSSGQDVLVRAEMTPMHFLPHSDKWLGMSRGDAPLNLIIIFRTVDDYMACWYSIILAVSPNDSGWWGLFISPLQNRRRECRGRSARISWPERSTV